MNVPSLNYLVSVRGVASAFVFNKKQEILAREVPSQYQDEGLRQIAERIIQLSQRMQGLSECRVEYESFGIWFRRFGTDENYYLILFFEKEADVVSLRQPINLAILNLEKMLRQIEEEKLKEASQSEVFKAAQVAERAFLEVSGEDANRVYARIELLSDYLIGPVGREILQNAFHELQLTLPLTDREKARALAQLCSEQLSHPDRRKVWLDQCEDVIQRI